MMTPEQRARRSIDKLLEAAGWTVQDYRDLNLGASLGVAIREFPLKSGFADYLLFVVLPGIVWDFPFRLVKVER